METAGVQTRAMRKRKHEEDEQDVEGSKTPPMEITQPQQSVAIVQARIETLSSHLLVAIIFRNI